MKNTDKIIIIDLEATCWQGAVPAGQENEIIEIGLSVLNTLTAKYLKIKEFWLSHNALL
jgi:inhibitor of KinA sporulation pathway (predicted exonuclease)